MVRARLAVGALILSAVGAIVLAAGGGVAGADPGLTPFGPGAPVPNPSVFPWEGGGSASLLTPNSDLAPELGPSEGDGQGFSGGRFGFVCNNQPSECSWGPS
jgi:hypothetical protein